MRWEPQRDGSFYARGGQRVIGMVVPLDDGSGVVWDINAVTWSKYRSSTQGKCSTVTGAKRAFRRAWRVWLAEHGLSETVHT